MTTIVTITPLAVEADSRTFKQAATVARAGYTSIVLEGRRSRLARGDVPFELQALLHDAADAGGAGGAETEARRQPAGSLGRALKAAVRRSPLILPWRLLQYVGSVVYRHGLLTVLRAPRASLYYLHAFYQFPAVAVLCVLHRASFIYDAHDFYSRIEELDGQTVLRRYVILPFERWLEAQCVKRAAAVVAVGEGIAELHARTFGRRPTVIRNCHDERLDREPPRCLRQALGLPSSNFVLVVLGQAKTGQAIAEMLEAMTGLPSNVHVALVGHGYAQHRTAIELAGLAGRVHVLPPVKPFEVVPFISDADAALILYYPRSVNYLHCLPNGLFQAIAAGLPLLYPDLPEIRRIAEEYGLGVQIDPRAPASLRAAVQGLLASPEQLTTYRRHAGLAGEALSWCREEQHLVELLERVLCRSEPRAVAF